MTSRLFCTMSHLILFKTSFSLKFLLWRGTGGREPGRTGGGRGTGDGRRKGGRRDLYDGRKRGEKFKKASFNLLFVTAYFQSKK